MLTHFMSGGITIPVSDVLKYVEEYNSKSRILPSHYQLGDKVSVRLRPKFVIDTAEVIKVHFSDGKVLYDLDVEFEYDDPDQGVQIGHTRVYNIDSAFLSEA